MWIRRNDMKLVEEEERKEFFWWKKLSSNFSNYEVVELVWIWHNNQLGMNALLEFFFSLTWCMFFTMP
jgi:hypothetical protein